MDNINSDSDNINNDSITKVSREHKHTDSLLITSDEVEKI